MNNFRNKLDFNKKTVVFVEKEYTLKTDHKTGLLLQQLQTEAKPDVNEKMVTLILGEKQTKDLFTELEEEAKKSGGSENYSQNLNVIIFGLMSILYDRPYEAFAEAFKNAQNGEEKK